MPRSKKSAREKREELKRKRLAAIAEKQQKSNVIDSNVTPQITEEELQQNARILEGKYYVKTGSLAAEEVVLKSEKNELQKEIDSFKDPVIQDMPEFLTDSNKEEERKEALDKIKYLLKRRFSLVTIADILETNSYDKLDEIIERKERLYKLVEKYTKEESSEVVRLFSGFKKVVGDEYSRTYSEQEERMRAAVAILYDGKYFKKGSDSEEVAIEVEDIVSNIIDNTDFNLACQIETEFVNYEVDRAITILSDLRSRSELQDLVEDLRNVSKTAAERSHAYSVMDMLITGKKKSREIISPEKGER